MEAYQVEGGWASHGGPQPAGLFPGNVYQQIQVLAAGLQQPPSASIAVDQILAELAMVLGTQGPFRRYQALDIRYKMTCELVFARVKLCLVCLEEFQFERTEGFGTKLLGGRIANGTDVRVLLNFHFFVRC